MNNQSRDFDFILVYAFSSLTNCTAFEIVDIVHNNFLCSIDVVVGDRTILDDILAQVVFEIINTTTSGVLV